MRHNEYETGASYKNKRNAYGSNNSGVDHKRLGGQIGKRCKGAIWSAILAGFAMCLVIGVIVGLLNLVIGLGELLFGWIPILGGIVTFILHLPIDLLWCYIVYIICEPLCTGFVAGKILAKEAREGNELIGPVADDFSCITYFSRVMHERQKTLRIGTRVFKKILPYVIPYVACHNVGYIMEAFKIESEAIASGFTYIAVILQTVIAIYTLFLAPVYYYNLYSDQRSGYANSSDEVVDQIILLGKRNFIPRIILGFKCLLWSLGCVLIIPMFWLIPKIAAASVVFVFDKYGEAVKVFMNGDAGLL